MTLSLSSAKAAVRAYGADIRALRPGEILLFLLVNLLLFQRALEQVIPVFSNVDELVTVGCGALCLVRWRRGSLLPQERWSIILLGVVFLVTLAGNVVYGYQSSMSGIAIDAFTCLKFFVTYYCCIQFMGDTNRVVRFLADECKLLFAVMLVFAVLNFAGVVNMTYEVKYGIPSFHFIFEHPTFQSALMVGLLCVFVASRKPHGVLIALACLMIALGLRTKGIVFCAIFLFLYLLKRSGKKIPVPLMVGVGVVLVFVFGWSQLMYYLQNDGFARTAMTKAAFAVGADAFPLGTGFATYGSWMSAVHYSPLYDMYGLSSVYGLSRDYSEFITDTFWPIVIGQAGFIGAVLFVVALGLMIYAAYKRSRDAGNYLILGAGFLYLLISSTAETAFFNPWSVYLAVMMGVALAAARSRTGAGEGQAQAVPYVPQHGEGSAQR